MDARWLSISDLEVLGKLKRSWGCTNGMPETSVGADIFARYFLDIAFPFDKAFPDNYSDMYRFLHCTLFNKLRCAPEEHPILFTEPLHITRRERERNLEDLIESFSCPSVFLATQPVLAIYDSGSTTGLVLDSGDGQTHAVPVYRGRSTPVAGSVSHSVTGSVLTQKIVEQFGILFTTTTRHSRISARAVKEQLCFVAADYDRELRTNTDSVISKDSYVLPDGKQMDLPSSQFLFRLPEALFRPEILGIVDKGVHETVAEAIAVSDPMIQRDLMSTVVLAGGNTTIRGFENRFRKELVAFE
ncbi:Actin, aortic smooth muscle [Podila humilis]|nr:Actin, aortic smooth muscle [Podila humilis]